MKLPSFVSDLALPPVVYHRQLRQWCKQMRESCPIIWNDESQGWLLFRYDDVTRVESDYHAFTSQGTVPNSDGANMLELDPPQHTKLRAFIAQAFSARTMVERTPQIEKIVDDLLERVCPRGEMDWMADFANLLPVMVITQVLGLPPEDWQVFKQWSDAILDGTAEQAATRESVHAYFKQAIEYCSRHPDGTDIISQLLKAEVDGERLSMRAVIELCYTLLVAGNVTTPNVLGNVMLCFNEHPEELERLRQHPELLDSAIEEVLRYMGPSRAGPLELVRGRVARTDVEFYGQLVRKGEYVEVSRFSANFDERQFPDAERFDIARYPNRHSTFGHGAHFCLGAPLARLEMKIALGALLKKFRRIQVLQDEPLRQRQSLLVFGLQRVPISLLRL